MFEEPLRLRSDRSATRKSVLSASQVGSAALTPFEEIDPGIYASWYLKSCYPGQMFHDEKLILDFLVAEAGKARGGPVLLEVGCGPTISHAIPFVPYVDSFILSDYLEANLEQVSAWAMGKAGAHDWSESVAYVLQAEGIDPTEDAVFAREQALRDKLTSIVTGDLRRQSPISVARQYKAVSCFYATEQAAVSSAEWLSVLRNLGSLVSNKGVLYLACLYETSFYAIHDVDLTTLRIPIASVNMALIEKALVSNGFPLHKASIEIHHVEGLVAEGLDRVATICAIKE